MKLLDCTLRDGGYYNNWDFTEPLVREYLTAMERLPIDYLEIGYRSQNHVGYGGKFYHTPTFVIDEIRVMAPSKKIALMLNEKETQAGSVGTILDGLQGKIHLIRLAVNPTRMDTALDLAQEVHSMGFNVGANFMYLSETLESEFWDEMDSWAKIGLEVLYFVDSYGSIFPEQLVKHIRRISSHHYPFKLGFHGHNNLEMAFYNSLTAYEAGCEYIDSTVLGMGRGAGNLKTELWLASCEKYGKLPIDYNVLSGLTTLFTTLYQQYQWGTNLAYMFSGLHSIPQKEVMDLVEKRYYSMNQILLSLQKQDNKTSNIKFDSIKHKLRDTGQVVVLGGGPSVLEHWTAIELFLTSHPHIPVVLSSAKHAHLLSKIPNPHYYCLVGNEGIRLEKQLSDAVDPTPICILPPSPRSFAHHIPSILHPLCFELDCVSFTSMANDIQTIVALQLAMEFPGITEILILGYDGYSGDSVTQRERELQEENEAAFMDAKTRIPLVSLTPTMYKNLIQKSIYAREFQDPCK